MPFVPHANLRHGEKHIVPLDKLTHTFGNTLRLTFGPPGLNEITRRCRYIFLPGEVKSPAMLCNIAGLLNL